MQECEVEKGDQEKEKEKEEEEEEEEEESLDGVVLQARVQTKFLIFQFFPVVMI